MDDSYIVKLLKDKNGFMKLEKMQKLNKEISEKKFSKYVEMVSLLDEQCNLSEQVNEYMYLLGFDLQQHLLGVMEVAHGTEKEVSCSMRDIFGALILMRASRFVIAHNHVDGNYTPSTGDKLFTAKVQMASNEMDIEFLNNLVIGKDMFTPILTEK